MKKILLASSILVGTAGLAAAQEVTLNGSGRFGLVYVDDGVGPSDTFLSYRLRFNIDAATETDTGIKFGGRIRLQYDAGDTIEDGQGAAELNAAMLFVESQGFRMEVGNANTAFDSLSTLYNAELGFISSTTGSYSPFSYDSYSSGPWGAPIADKVGIFTSYTAGALTARLSYVDYSRIGDNAPGLVNETGVSIDYDAGMFKLGVGYVANGAGNGDNDVYALLGEYGVNSETNVGIQLIGQNGGVDNRTLTLYGNTKMASGVTLGAFLSGISADVDYANNYAIGLGAGYDLGGPTLKGTIQQGFDDQTYADLGINFSF